MSEQGSTVDVQNEMGYALDEARLRDAALTTLAQQNAEPHSTLTIAVVDNDTVAGLNQRFRGIDAPTDILSFPSDEPTIFVEDNSVVRYLGDLIIAYPYASAQAERLGHALMDSLALLVAHGTLHLLGFDHDTDENRAAMWTAQANALTALGIAPEIAPALEDSEHE
ncbi:MAG: rRNA maturation RNase YbeY [Burkholderiales bacterium]|nr:rRNA maturation RNase YbeY [Anaerolineae bacterium]